MKHELDLRHVTLTKRLAERLPDLPLDRSKIEQAFVNLLTNAIHAMPEGGALEIRTAIAPPTAPPAVVAEIADTGTGIPAELLPKVFDPFFTTKPTGQGTGLGLTVTKKIVELHGGTIAIRNRSDGGVIATLVFPLRGRPAG